MTPSWLPMTLCGTVLLVACTIWQSRINTLVPLPYLDEIFHVPQAQAYCHGNFRQWHPKITTPPGLYLLSYLAFRITGDCSLTTLRLVNLITLMVILLTVYAILHEISQSPNHLHTTSPVSYSQHRSLNRTLTALNVTSFPLVFFFSGLFYTDVSSICSVLLTLLVALRYSHIFLTTPNPSPAVLLRHWILIILFGTISILFRQTNIFWITIFPITFTITCFFKSITAYPTPSNFPSSTSVRESWFTIIHSAWSWNIVHNPPISQAYFFDYIRYLVTVLTVSLHHIPAIFIILTPYICLFLQFAGFVYFNKGVALGDKSNHTLTLHIPQLLYIWPYIFFFSWPIIIFPGFTSLLLFVRSNNEGYGTLRRSWPPRLITCFIFVTLSTLAVHFNTQVHPFILADNRHYPFYVFRMLFRTLPTIKYLAVPLVYLPCMWFCIYGFPFCQSCENQNNPSSPLISVLIFWSVATAGNLVLTGLFEPRYNILPWLTWRLFIFSPDRRETPRRLHGRIASQLLLELAWFVIINLGCTYIFLYRPFTWPSEPGRFQRFLW